MKENGNERETLEFLVRNIGLIVLPKIGLLKDVSVPSKNGELVSIKKPEDLQRFSSSDSRKKADFYLNGYGVSHKQMGASQLANRLQRHSLLGFLNLLGIRGAKKVVNKIDEQVKDVHYHQTNRNKNWEQCFNLIDFKKMLRYLMTQGSQNNGLSENKVDLILTSSKVIESVEDVKLYTFEEYFKEFADKIKIAIRRCWRGQFSKSEHSRAISLGRKEGNRQWIFDDVVGEPKSGWNPNFPSGGRNTTYYFSIEQAA